VAGDDLSAKYHFADFTEDGYRRALIEAKRHYSFEPFGTDADGPHVLWRHDVDISLHRALALARIEAEEGVRSTWFLYLRSEFYNLLEAPVLARARELLSLGHWLGLHFDASAHPELESEDELAAKLAAERDWLSGHLGHPVEAFSFHNPTIRGIDFHSDRIAGMHNTYGRELNERYDYISDSNGYWRHRRLIDVLEAADEERLHVLTHPEWWQAEPMSPRDRVMRCIEGRARQVEANYDLLLETWDRENIA
jgi:hypothetical protein